MEHFVCGVVGAGAMGTGIAQVTALAGWEVRIFDKDNSAIIASREKLLSVLNRLSLKGKISDEDAKAAFGRVYFIDNLNSLKGVDIVIEAVIENLEIKQSIFKTIESIVDDATIIASNTSSLSITSLAYILDDPSRMIGIHFFNPPGLMKLVEVIPGYLTSKTTVERARHIIDSWDKKVVLAKDSPGFIVNKVARPFYSEALRLYEENLARPEEIDWVMTVVGGFRMGPFTLMDYIGHDVNYAVTESIWRSFYHEPRYKPSLIQKKLIESGSLGRKSGKGFYRYGDEDKLPLMEVSDSKAQYIFKRILFMLINEAADTVYYGICDEKDVETAMTMGVNYPKGLLAWANDYGWSEVKGFLDNLYNTYHEERYRVSPYITKKLKDDQS